MGTRKGTLPLTVPNVLEVVERVPPSKWREWDEATRNVSDENIAESDGFDFRDALGIPAKQMEAIAKKHSSLDSRIRAGITWWLKKHPQASWRKVLLSLDAVQESELANEIRRYAEPPKEPSLTVDNVNNIMKIVENPVSYTGKSVANSLGVPSAVEIGIIGTDESNSHPNPGQEVGEYWRNTVPGASWQMLAHALYQNNERKALEGVKKYLKDINIIKDTSLTHQNVMEVARQLRFGRLIDVLGLPTSKRQQITERYRYGSEYQLLEAAVSKYLLSHPCPSWPLLTSCLRRWHVKYPKSVPATAVEAATNYIDRKDYVYEEPTAPREAKKCGYLQRICVGVLAVGVCGTMIVLVFGFPIDIPKFTGGLLDRSPTLTQHHSVSSTPSPMPDQTCPSSGCDDGILEKPPTMNYIDLITWKNGDENSEFRLINHITGSCDGISRQLKVEKAVYDGWVKENPSGACHKLIQHWLDSGCGPYPVTWNGLFKVLNDVQLGVVAKDLKEALLNRIV